MEPLVRKPLCQQVANALLEEIRRGRWKTRLPGYRELGDLMGVSRTTVEAALDHLTREHVLLPPCGRRGRKIAQNGAQVSDLNCRRVLIVGETTICRLWPIARDVVDETIHRLGRRGYETEYVACPAFAQPHPEIALDELRAKHPDCLWILVKPLHAVVRWAVSRDLPAVLLGGERRGSDELPCVAMHVAPVIANATRQLLALGHRHIVICISDLGEHGRSSTVQHVKPVFEETGIPFNATRNVPDFPSSSPERFQEFLIRIFSQQPPPTAMIVNWIGEAIAVSSFCMQRGIRIPQDLSLVVVEIGSYAPWHTPKLSGYMLTAAPYVNHLERWVESRGTGLPRGLTVIQPELIRGETIAPPRSREFRAARC